MSDVVMPTADEVAAAQGNGAVAARPRLALAVLCTAMFLASLDMFIVNVALRDIGADYREPSLARLSWILNGYTIVYGALLVPAGRIADRIGRRTAFLVGLGLFLGASLLCAASPSLPVLVGCRALQAAGAGILTPASLGLVLTALPVEMRPRAVRIWASSGAIAGAIGPVVGGLLIAFSWRWIFALNIPICIAAIVLARRVLPASDRILASPLPAATPAGDRAATLATGEPATTTSVRDRAVTLAPGEPADAMSARDRARETAAAAKAPFPDLVGGALLAIAVGALALALVQGPTWGFASRASLGCWLGAIGAAAWFAVRCTKHPAPLLEASLFREPGFAAASAVVFLAGIVFAIDLVGVVLYLERTRHLSAVGIGLAMAPGPLVVPVVAVASTRLVQRFGTGAVIAAGCVAMGIGALLFPFAFTAAWMIGGVGVGLTFPTGIAAATAHVPRARASTASAVVNMARQIGSVCGTSLLVAVLASGGSLASAWQVGAGLAFFAAVLAALSLTRPAFTTRPA